MTWVGKWLDKAWKRPRQKRCTFICKRGVINKFRCVGFAQDERLKPMYLDRLLNVQKWVTCSLGLSPPQSQPRLRTPSDPRSHALHAQFAQVVQRVRFSQSDMTSWWTSLTVSDEGKLVNERSFRRGNSIVIRSGSTKWFLKEKDRVVHTFAECGMKEERQDNLASLNPRFYLSISGRRRLRRRMWDGPLERENARDMSFVHGSLRPKNKQSSPESVPTRDEEPFSFPLVLVVLFRSVCVMDPDWLVCSPGERRRCRWAFSVFVSPVQGPSSVCRGGGHKRSEVSGSVL